MIEPAQAETLQAVLEVRGDPMGVCSRLPWLSDLATIPEDATAPLAMSGPHPRAVGSYGAECIAWARTDLKLNLRWWQALAVTRQLEHDSDGALVWREIVESGPRRIGKSVRLRVTALWRLANAHRFLEPQLVMLVSKDLAVGKEIHRGAWRWAGENDWTVIRLNGAQEIETPAGDRWLLRAPNAAYGYDVGYGQVDESWGVDPQAITDGIEPALLERQSPQLHLTSTAHARASSLMRRRLTAALRDADPDVLLLLWGAPPDADFADEATWRAASPHWSEDRRALVARKYNAALAGEDEPEFDDPDPIRGWAAQYLNVWPGLITRGDSLGAIDLADWARLQDGAARQPDTACLVVDVAPDRKHSSIGVAASHGDRTLLMVRHGVGTAWVVPELVKLVEKRDIVEVALNPSSQAGALLPDIEAEGIEVERLTPQVMGQACSAFLAGIGAGRYAHVGQPELDAAVENAKTRRSGEVEIWDRRKWSVDISPLVAVSAAAFRWAVQAENEYDLDDSIG